MLRTIPEVLRPLADYIELIFCVMVVATISFFPDGFASIVSRWFTRRKQPSNRRPSATTFKKATSPKPVGHPC